MKRLCRSTSDKMIAGVCGGIAKYLDIDVTIVRIIATALIAGGGSGLIIYIACAILMPTEDEIM